MGKSSEKSCLNNIPQTKKEKKVRRLVDLRVTGNIIVNVSCYQDISNTQTQAQHKLNMTLFLCAPKENGTKMELSLKKKKRRS